MEFTEEELRAMQLEIEKDSFELSVRNAERAEQKDEERGKGSRSGTAAINVAVPACVEAVREYLETYSKVSSHANGQGYPFISQLGAEVSAAVAMHVLMDTVRGSGCKLTAVAFKVGSAVNRELRVRAFKKAEPGLFSIIYERTIKDPVVGQRHGTTALVHAVNKMDNDFPNLSRDQMLKVGLILIDLCSKTTGWFERKKLKYGGRFAVDSVLPTEKFLEFIQTLRGNMPLTLVNRPMICPPTPWEGPIGGGYLSRGDELVTGWRRSGHSIIQEAEIPSVYEAINEIQSTPFRINKRVLDVLGGCMDRNWEVGSLTSMEEAPQPPKPKEWEEMSQQERQDWKHVAKTIRDEEVRRRGKRFVAYDAHATAKEYSKYDRFWFPCNLDFRGRIYYVGTGLNPQGPDHIRGLLQFANGKPLGETGAQYLAIHGANCYGIDKVSFEDRIAWVEKNESLIVNSATAPFEELWWAEADDPFQFLAFCFEWADVLVSPDPEQYVSHIPVGIDGSCNGIQHLSALFRDEVGGAAVNLIPCEKPSDIYGIVAKDLQKRLVHVLNTGSPQHALWAEAALSIGIDRKLTKRSVMTLPYGVTQYSIVKYLRQEIESRTVETHLFREGADYKKRLSWLAEQLWASISDVVVAGREALDWLQQVSEACMKVDQEKAISWETPLGWPVVQNYKKRSNKRVSVLFAGARYQCQYKEDHHSLYDNRKSKNAIVPNFIHSLDATHLMMTVNMCKGADIRDYLMVHDSYAVHAGAVETLGIGCRESFRMLYEDRDVIGEFIAQIEAKYPGIKLPAPPKRGALDLNDVLLSPYFFA